MSRINLLNQWAVEEITRQQRELAEAQKRIAELEKRAGNLVAALRCAPMSYPQKQLNELRAVLEEKK